VLDPTRNLAPVRTACGLELSDDGSGGVSADGRWLLVNGSTGRRAGGARSALLIDLGRAFDPQPVARPVGPGVVGPVAWASPQAVLYTDAKGALLELRTERVAAGGTAGPAEVPGLASADRPVLVTGGRPDPVTPGR
jgi:hypothetical protein